MNQRFDYNRPSTHHRAPSKRMLSWRILLVFALIQLLPARAATYTPDNLPIPYLQDRTQYVSNPDGILSKNTVDSLNLWLGQMEASHGVQTVLAVVDRIEGGEPYDFCMALGRKYKIGSKKQNSGLIILLSTGDRAYYILTGRGLEGALPDAICKRIENHQMLPYLREGDWDKAMLATVRAITKYVDGDDSLVGDSDFESDDDIAALIAVGGLFFAFFAIIIFAIWYDERKKSYCPNCHKYLMKKVGGKVTKDALLGMYTHHDTYRCTGCNFERVRTWEEFASSGSSGGGSSYHSSSGGGRSSFGGSFGGGSFGGGGAGGRF